MYELMQASGVQYYSLRIWHLNYPGPGSKAQHIVFLHPEFPLWVHCCWVTAVANGLILVELGVTVFVYEVHSSDV